MWRKEEEMSNYITIIKWGICFVVFLVLVIGINSYANLKAELATSQDQVKVLSSTIEEQNKAIDELKLDVEKYKEQKPQIVEKIVTKYKNVEVKDTTCEETLKSIYNLQQEFFRINK